MDTKNREIKFRFKYKELTNKGYREWFEFYTLDDLIKGSGITTAEIIAKDQFTGLKDKNGKEIYESDRLKAKSNQTKKNIEGIVEWRNDEAAFRLVVENDYMYKLHDIHNVEVVGNEFEGLAYPIPNY